MWAVMDENKRIKDTSKFASTVGAASRISLLKNRKQTGTNQSNKPNK
jgi:hypothetical protein